MQTITITRIVLSPDMAAICSLGWRAKGSTGAYTIASSNVSVPIGGILATPIQIQFDENVYNTGIELMAFPNCNSNAKYTEDVPVSTTTTTSTSTTTTSSSTTTSTTQPTTSTTTTTTVAPTTTTTSTTTTSSSTTTTTTICPTVTDIVWNYSGT